MPIERKTIPVLVRMAPSMFDRLRKVAEDEGRRLPEWLREVAQRAASATESREIVRSGGRHAAEYPKNLNQRSEQVSEQTNDAAEHLAKRIDALADEMQSIIGFVTAQIAAATEYNDPQGMGYMVEQGGDLYLRLRDYARRVRAGDYGPAVVWRERSMLDADALVAHMTRGGA